MLVLVGEQQRMFTHDRPEDLVALAGVQVARVGGEDFLDVFRPVEHHQMVGVGRDAQGEHIAVAASHRGQEPVPVALEQHALHHRGQPRSRRV